MNDNSADKAGKASKITNDAKVTKGAKEANDAKVKKVTKTDKNAKASKAPKAAKGTKATKVSDPNSKGGNGFLWGLGVLLAIIALVIGYIVWNGQGAKTEAVGEMDAKDVAMDVSFEDNAVKLKSPEAKKDAIEVDLYEDYSCPHCAELATATDEKMKEKIESGELIVNIRTLNFLDGKEIETQSGHSTKAAAAMSELAKSGDAKAYWNLRDYLLQNQQDIANKWDADDFGNAAGELGAKDETIKAVKSVDVKQGNQVAKANYDKLDSATGSVSSPRVLKDGKDVAKDNINGWIDEVLS